MKKIIILLLMVVLIDTSMDVCAQNMVAQRQPASEKVIPKIVLLTFQEQYTDVLLKGWFVTHLTYWQNDNSSDWYTGWYGQRNIIVYTFQNPNYYEVEFEDNPGELSRAIYNRYGYWYETRTLIKGLKSRILRMDAEGNIIQVKDLDE